MVTVKEEIIRTPEEEIQLLRVSNSKAKTRLKSGRCKNIARTEELIKSNNSKIAELLNKV
ncbi:hypothetical protein D3C86_1739350 [compost metagenome]